MASNAVDLLDSAQVVQTLDEAIVGCSLVVGTSARERASAWPQVNARETGKLLLASVAQGAEVALVFGRENSGLTNQELDKCHYLGHIDTNPEYGILNVAMGVQIFAYELWTQVQNQEGYTVAEWRRKPATMDELTQLYEHLEQTLLDINYLKPAKNDRIMRRMKRLFHRANLEAKELLIFRGILRSLQRIARINTTSSGEKSS
jgi:tRNA/rRNA methyltransferase/tRNA (cytidine32/uridine32-2'-O)-methyltransferase